MVNAGLGPGGEARGGGGSQGEMVTFHCHYSSRALFPATLRSVCTGMECRAERDAEMEG